jgi:hypothetical protein
MLAGAKPNDPLFRRVIFVAGKQAAYDGIEKVVVLKGRDLRACPESL